MARVSKILDDFSGSEYYVDYNAGDDMLGDGSASNPWQTIKHAVESGITRNSTNGDRINLKSGYAHVVASTPNVATYGTPTVAAPLFFQGYTSAANDGGYAEITCTGTVSLVDTYEPYLRFAYLSVTSGGYAINNHSYAILIECKVESTGTGYRPYYGASNHHHAYYCTFVSNYTTNPWGKAFQISGGGELVNCLFLINGQGGAALKSNTVNCLAIVNNGTTDHGPIFTEAELCLNTSVVINGSKNTTGRHAFSGSYARMIGCYVQGADTAYGIERTRMFVGNGYYDCTTASTTTSYSDPYAYYNGVAIYEDAAQASSGIATATSLTDYALSGNGGISNLEFPVGWSNGTPGAKAYSDGTGIGFQESGSSSSSSSSGSKWTTITDLTGLVAWYKPETLASTYSNGDSISTWADSSGNGHDLTGSGTTRPLALANAFGTYMAADFDGTDDLLSSAGFSWTSSMTCMAIVMQRDVDKNYAHGVILHDSATPQYPNDIAGLGLIGDSTHWVDGLYTAGRVLVRVFDTESGIPGIDTPYIFTLGNGSLGRFGRGNGTKMATHELSKSGGSSSALINAPSTTAYIHMGFAENVSSSASTYALNGKICEVIIWSPTSNTNEVYWVEGYLADKYGITLADGHLFKNAAPQNSPTTYNATGSGSSYTNVAAAKFTRLE